MKYNITNLNELKKIPSINDNISEITSQLSNFRINKIEECIKELLKPYIDLEIKSINEALELLDGKGYSVDHLFHDTFEEFNITENSTNKKDYFLVRNVYNNSIMNDCELKATIQITDIKREIKGSII